MPDQKRYLSTDPSAGLDGGGDGGESRYLSTDPNAGENGSEGDGGNSGAAPRGGSPIPPGLVTGAAMKSAPGIVAGVHQGAKAFGKVAVKTAAATRYAPAIVAYDVATDLAQGNTSGAVKKAAGAAAVASVPGVIARVERATRPTAGVTRGAAGRFVAGAATPLRRAAGAMSRAAGPVGLAVETVFGEDAAGHRPYGETPETTAERQARFQREYDTLIAAKRSTRPDSPEWTRIQNRLGELLSALGSGIRNRR